MFLNIPIDWIILKTYDQQFTLTTKKSLHIIFKIIWISQGILFCLTCVNPACMNLCGLCVGMIKRHHE